MARRVLRRREVEARVGLKKSDIYARIAAGEFPRPIPLGARAVGWLEDEVDAWVTARVAERERRQGAVR
jgi:prophage regulatory protein